MATRASPSGSAGTLGTRRSYQLFAIETDLLKPCNLNRMSIAHRSLTEASQNVEMICLTELIFGRFALFTFNHGDTNGLPSRAF
jgi:hypothetical protein